MMQTIFLSYLVVSAVLAAGMFRDLIRLATTDGIFSTNNIAFSLVALNTEHAVLSVAGYLLMRAFLGAIRREEWSRIQSTVWRFFVLELVFVGSVAHLTRYSELFVWAFWTTNIGLLDTLAAVCHERFEHVSQRGSFVRPTENKRLLSMALFVCCASCFLLYEYALNFAGTLGRALVTVLVLQCFIVVIKAANVVAKFAIHAVDASTAGTWESRGTFIYYTDFISEVLSLLSSLIYYLQLLYLHK